MLIGHGDAGAVVGGHLVEIRGALTERSALGHGRPWPGRSERQNRHRLPDLGEHVDALVPVL